MAPKPCPSCIVMHTADEAQRAKQLKEADIRWMKKEAKLAKLTTEERAHRGYLQGNGYFD